jgi:hypothetical protein
LNGDISSAIKWWGYCKFVVVALSSLIVAMTLPVNAEAGRTCQDPEFHQFDFWLGTWSVTHGGKEIGRNTIESVLGGCALLESWASETGVRGHSLNIYDAGRRVWHQTWVDNTGSLLVLEGTLQGQAMILDGTLLDPSTHQQLAQRVTWTRNPDGTVRQLWQSSPQGGRSWVTEFDGLYHRSN